MHLDYFCVAFLDGGTVTRVPKRVVKRDTSGSLRGIYRWPVITAIVQETPARWRAGHTARHYKC